MRIGRARAEHLGAAGRCRRGAAASHVRRRLGAAGRARAWSSTTNDRPVQWLQGLYRPDRYQYEMQLSRVGSIDAKVWVSNELSAQFH